MLKMEEIEKSLDEKLEKVLKNPVFLQAVGTALNLNSYRKVWMNQTLIAGWKFLQLPNKRDQERTLHLINELHHRVAELETKLEPARQGTEVVSEAAELDAAAEAKSDVRVTRKKTTSNGSELVSIQ